MSFDSTIPPIQDLKIPDPLTQYSNFLAVQKAINDNNDYVRGLRDTEALNTQYRNALRPDGTPDPVKLFQGLANANLGSHIPALQKSLLENKAKEADIGKTQAEVGKLDAETLANHFKQAKEYLSNVTDAEGLKAWYTQNFQKPDLAQEYEARGVTLPMMHAIVDQSVKNGTFPAILRNLQLGPDKAMEGQYVTSNLGGHVVTRRVNKFGIASPTMVSDDKVTQDPNAHGTTVNVNTGGKIEEAGGKAFSEEQGKYLSEQLKTARIAPQLARDADRAIELINGGVFSGKMANFQTEAAKVLKAMGIPVGPEITNTEQLSALLADKVLAAVHTSGIGARGMDTPAEREYIEKARLGNKTLDRETLITGANLLKKAANYSIQNYNETASTAPSSWFQGSGAPRSLPALPERGVQTKATTTPSQMWTLNGKALRIGDVVNGHRYKGGNPKNGNSWE